MLLSGGRSVYSERELSGFEASPDKPVKVINYLLVDYIDPPRSHSINFRTLASSKAIRRSP